MADTLKTKVTEACRLWELTLLETLSETPAVFTARVSLSVAPHEDFLEAILKVSVNCAEAHSAQSWLRAHQSTGRVPRVILKDDRLGASVIERLYPGSTLAELVMAQNSIESDSLATKTICELIKRFHCDAEGHAAMPETAESGRAQLNPVRKLTELGKGLSSLNGFVDERLIRKAQRIVAELGNDARTDRFLHGDLHHHNVLSKNGAWYAIDPHGYLGDPAFEIVAMIRNPIGYLESVANPEERVQKRLSILCQELPFASERIHAWAFAGTMLSLAWTAQDQLREGER